MGKAMRWLRAMLGLKREKDADHSTSAAGERKEKNRWSFSKSGNDSTGAVQAPVTIPTKALSETNWKASYLTNSREEQNQHAIAVAAASAAAADAAVAAAQAAVAVVRLTNYRRAEILAALKIQNVFRGYLARKALRALKGLVKLQALVRGYLVRKRTAATFHCMQALIRAQTTVRSQRARRSHNKFSTKINPNDFETPKIVEIDSFKPRSRSRRFNSLLSEFGEERPYYSPVASPAGEALDWYFTARNSGWPGTPARSVSGEGYFRNYMASTKSFKAKLRSRSAPKQRPEIWKRVALSEIVRPRNSMSCVGMQPTCRRVGEDDEEDDESFGF